MDTFLHLVAEDLLQKYGSELSDITVVFPNNRARLFFNKHLTEIAQKPVWSPQYTTIQTLFRSVSRYEVPDTLKLISDLYTVYIEETGQMESFDEFYFWGEILLNDFDDIDKNMVDAKALFRNIKEQGEYIDTFEHLTDEQKEALRMFFRNFSPDMRTELKDRFIRLWNSLIEVYHQFKEKLTAQQLAYEGMLNRDVIANISKNGLERFSSSTYIFAGFNVLNECEKKLFSFLQNAGKALFYWDYDTFYVDKKYHEAGTFMRENLLRFPNVLSRKRFTNFNVGEKRNISFISASTENAQAKLLDVYLSNTTHQSSDTAVVLCNESLLLPVLHSIPDSVKDINVTMGFPLVQTPAYSLVKSLLEMQVPTEERSNKHHSFRLQTFLPVLKHPYVKIAFEGTDKLLTYLTENNRFYPSLDELHISDNLTLLFTPAASSAELTGWLLKVIRTVANYHKGNTKNETDSLKDVIYDDLYKEALFRIYTQINRIHLLLTEENIQMNIQTLSRLIKNIFSRITIPFSGEPVKGMQIMGFLETRNLDFKNVIMLSVNEGTLPNSGKESSFIPYNLRKGYGMTTIDHKNSLYAYYFYRLLQRAENITLVYNTATEGMNKGQMSRFMLQLLAETDFPIQTADIRSDIRIVEPNVIQVRKTDEIIHFLKTKYNTDTNPDNYLSATALNTLLDCSLKFYFRYVLHLSSKEDLTEDMDASIFGTIFHKAAEIIYGNKTGKIITAEQLNNIAKDKKTITEIVDMVFKSEYFKLPAESSKNPEYTGEQLINRKVIIDFLRKLLLLDELYAPFTIVSSEQFVSQVITIGTPEQINVKIGGIVDRMDLKENTLRIVDYKTGGTPLRASGVSSLFEQTKDRAGYMFQAFLYATMVAEQVNEKYVVKPTLAYIHKATRDYTPDLFFTVDKKNILIENIYDYKDEFNDHLKALISDLFDQNTPFSQTPVTEKCSYCDYREICRRRN
jgi:RecB family exonuclease